MVNFFERLFGKKDTDPSPMPTERSRGEDPEILAIREKNLRRALEMYLDRSATDEEFATVRAEMTGGDATRSLEPLTVEEMRGRVSKIWQQLGRVPEAVPVGDVYEPMGNRQGAFEQSLAKNLGRELTQDDLEDARAMFEGNAEIRKAWSTMVGEEVSHYAAEVASRITRNRLRESRPVQRERLEGDIAAK